MADPKAIQFLEGLYARVDKQVRDIVSSMLPNQTVGAQDDGTVVANQWNILNFQGPGVTVSEESGRRRVNVYVPGAPVAATTTTIVSSTTAKAHSLWTGSANSAPPSNWQTTGFSDASWTAAVSASYGTPVPISGTTPLWSSSTPVALAAMDQPTPLSVSSSGTVGPDIVSGISTTYYPPIPTGGAFTTYTVTATAHVMAGTYGSVMQLTCPVFDASGTMLNSSEPGTNGMTDGQTVSFTVPGPGGLHGGNFSTADHFRIGSSAYGTSYAQGSFDYTITWDGTPPTTGLPGEQCLLRQTFTLPAGSIASATLDINADAHLLGVYINGNFVSGSISGSSSTLHFTLPPGQLVTGGSNLIAVNAQNYTSSPDYAWVAYKLTIGTSAAGTDTRYQLLSEKNQANGYAGLDVGGRVATVRLGTGTADGTTYLRGDQTWAAAASGGGGWTQNAQIHRAAAVSIANTTYTDVTFDTLDFDTDTMWNSGTPTRLTIHTGGVYLCVGLWQWAPNANGERQIIIFQNGANWLAMEQRANQSSFGQSMHVTAVAKLVVSDYVGLRVYQSSGGSLARQDMLPYLSVVRVG